MLEGLAVEGDLDALLPDIEEEPVQSRPRTVGMHSLSTLATLSVAGMCNCFGGDIVHRCSCCTKPSALLPRAQQVRINRI